MPCSGTAWAAVRAAALMAAAALGGRTASGGAPDDVAVIDLTPGPGGSWPDILGVAGGSAFVRTLAAAAPLVRTDGLAATPVTGIASVHGFEPHGNDAWLVGRDTQGAPLLAVVRDGASSATAVAGAAQGFVSVGGGPVAVRGPAGDRIVFLGDDGVRGPELWAADTNTLALTLLTDTFSRDTAFLATLPVRCGDRAAFWVCDPPPGWAPCTSLPNCDPPRLDGAVLTLLGTDGTAAGTTTLRSHAFPRWPDEASPVAACGTALGLGWFADASLDGRPRLARTDGTTAGTFDVGGPNLGTPRQVRDLGEVAAVQVQRAGGPVLVTSDGTAAGTGPAGGVWSSALASYFAPDDAAAGGHWFVAAATLLASDGTAQPRALRLLSLVGQPWSLSPVGARVVFTAAAPGGGVRVWRSDGTTAGTRRVRDLEFEVVGDRFVAVGDRIVFAATDASAGMEIRSFPAAWAAEVPEPYADSDGDEFPDAVEDALASSPDDPAHRPLGLIAAHDAGAADVRRLRVRLRFDGRAGSVRVSGRMPVAAGRVLLGDRVIVDAGGAVRGFELDLSGRARSADGAFRLRARLDDGHAVGSASVPFTATLDGIDLAAALADEGLVAGVRRVRASLDVTIYHASTMRRSAVPVDWRAGARAGRGL